MYPVEYLNTINCTGLPLHKLKLKKGCPVMVLRNLNPEGGVCNGSRGILTRYRNRVLEVRLLTGRDYHGFRNPCGFWVGYARVRVRVGLCRPWLNPYPRDGFRVTRTVTRHTVTATGARQNRAGTCLQPPPPPPSAAPNASGGLPATTHPLRCTTTTTTIARVSSRGLFLATTTTLRRSKCERRSGHGNHNHPPNHQHSKREQRSVRRSKRERGTACHHPPPPPLDMRAGGCIGGRCGSMARRGSSSPCWIYFATARGQIPPRQY
jgi:PIF1-like helicase